MEIHDEKRMVILDEKGNEHVVEILFTYEHEERKTKYVFFFEEKDPDEVMVMRYTDDGELEAIEDDEEYDEDAHDQHLLLLFKGFLLAEDRIDEVDRQHRAGCQNKA